LLGVLGVWTVWNDVPILTHAAAPVQIVLYRAILVGPSAGMLEGAQSGGWRKKWLCISYSVREGYPSVLIACGGG
jgi:hypothetical protein